VMLGVAVVASLAWGRAGRRRGAKRGRNEPAGSTTEHTTKGEVAS